MQVLLVDDEVDLISALAERLDLRGIPAQWAASAKEALKKIDERCFDIAVLDIKMPEIDGIELMHQIQVMCPNTKFIFLTGQGSEQSQQLVAEKCMGATYLVKPVDIQTLIQEMKAIIKCKDNQ